MIALLMVSLPSTKGLRLRSLLETGVCIGNLCSSDEVCIPFPRVCDTVNDPCPQYECQQVAAPIHGRGRSESAREHGYTVGYSSSNGFTRGNGNVNGYAFGLTGSSSGNGNGYAVGNTAVSNGDGSGSSSGNGISYSRGNNRFTVVDTTSSNGDGSGSNGIGYFRGNGRPLGYTVGSTASSNGDVTGSSSGNVNSFSRSNGNGFSFGNTGSSNGEGNGFPRGNGDGFSRGNVYGSGYARGYAHGHRDGAASTDYAACATMTCPEGTGCRPALPIDCLEGLPCPEAVCQTLGMPRLITGVSSCEPEPCVKGEQCVESDEDCSAEGPCPVVSCEPVSQQVYEDVCKDVNCEPGYVCKPVTRRCFTTPCEQFECVHAAATTTAAAAATTEMRTTSTEEIGTEDDELEPEEPEEDEQNPGVQDGSKLWIDVDQPEPLAITTSCAALTCPTGKGCEEKDGVAQCVSISTLGAQGIPDAAIRGCAAVFCPTGLVCQYDKFGLAICGSIPSMGEVKRSGACKATYCPDGFICVDAPTTSCENDSSLPCPQTLCVEVIGLQASDKPKVKDGDLYRKDKAKSSGFTGTQGGNSDFFPWFNKNGKGFNVESGKNGRG